MKSKNIHRLPLVVFVKNPSNNNANRQADDDDRRAVMFYNGFFECDRARACLKCLLFDDNDEQHEGTSRLQVLMVDVTYG